MGGTGWCAEVVCCALVRACPACCRYRRPAQCPVPSAKPAAQFIVYFPAATNSTSHAPLCNKADSHLEEWNPNLEFEQVSAFSCRSVQWAVKVLGSLWTWNFVLRTNERERSASKLRRSASNALVVVKDCIAIGEVQPLLPFGVSKIVYNLDLVYFGLKRSKKANWIQPVFLIELIL